MQRFRLRAAAVLVSLFLPALAVCASATPSVAFLASCSPGVADVGSCCEEEPDSCPPPGRVPQDPRCRACEGLLVFATVERLPLRTPGAASPLPATVAVAAFPPAFYSPHQLRTLSASPPLHLLNESLRN